MSVQQKKRQFTHAMQGRPNMTRKEALAVLYRLEKTYTRTVIELVTHLHTNTMDTPEHDAFRRQVRQALEVFTTAVHGPCPVGALSLCERCLLHYAPLVAWYHDERRWLHSCRCCQACYTRLQQERTLLTDEEVDKELGL